MFLSKPIQLTILSHALYLIIMKSYCHTTLRGGEKKQPKSHQHQGQLQLVTDD